MYDTKRITRDNMPPEVHKRYIDDQMGEIPATFATDSVIWDDQTLARRRNDGRTWLEWLFDIRPSEPLAEFEQIPERPTPFTSSLVKGIHWTDVINILIDKLEDENLSHLEREFATIILDLLKEGKEKNRDLHHARSHGLIAG
ncbi:MAG: hypothetical protein P0S95_01315 [Rhabdochlamydiaceae bacterium]|nr:hypothetical protein [Candidatus Amphrikana amoebophyrae]